MFGFIRRRTASAFDNLLAIAELILSLCGATAAMLFGKLLLAVVLAIIAFGILLRLTSRRSRQ